MNRWATVLTSVINGRDLSDADAHWVIEEIFRGNATPAQIAGIAVALRAKGEAVNEVLAFAEALLSHAPRVSVSREALDIVGTGGDSAHTVNISTMAAVAAAATGQLVVKHGNRAVSSRCGTADVLEHLGIAIDLDAAGAAAVAEEVGITFCLAGKFHRAMANVAAPRRELGIPTVFNLLGTLANPARPKYSAVGVADGRRGELLAEVFLERGMSALVFHGHDGLDEITVTGGSSIWHNLAGTVEKYELDPRDLGLTLAPPESLRGGDVEHNARVVRSVLGAGVDGPVRDAVVLNAAAGLVAAGGTTDIHTALLTGMAAVRSAIDSGRAIDLLDRWIESTQHAAARR